MRHPKPYMKIPFTKLHGAKNDFLLTLAADAPASDLQAIAIAICDRYTGVGADGWMIVDPTEGSANDASFDASIRLFNSDGSEPEKRHCVESNEGKSAM